MQTEWLIVSAIAATDTTQAVAAITGTVPYIKRGTAYSAKKGGDTMTTIFAYGFDHKEIRSFATDEANGTICEQALLAVKNLESAVYKRKALTSTEWKAVEMLMQCAEELYNHAAEKPIDDTRSMLPREIREGLKRNIAIAVAQKSKNYVYYDDSDDIVIECIVDQRDGTIWCFNDDGRTFLYHKG